jgi:hypothetical protein
MDDKSLTSADAPKPKSDDKKLSELPPRGENAAQDEQVKGGVALAGGGVPGIRER